jgi:hypothetical protein
VQDMDAAVKGVDLPQFEHGRVQLPVLLRASATETAAG